MRDPRLTCHAKTMRKMPTEAELRLWLELRAKRFSGAKFRRQKVIGPYIVDFACRTPMLVIEVDGDSHGVQADYDTRRSAYLQDQGYDVIRFANSEVIENMEGVLSIVEARLPSPLPTLSPEGERAMAAAR